MKIQLKRSSQLDGGAAKEPTSEQMTFGELAVNYSTADPALFIKKEDGSIIRIAGDNAIGNDPGDIEGYPDLGDGGGATLDDRYLRLGAGSFEQTVLSTGITTFSGDVKAPNIVLNGNNNSSDITGEDINIKGEGSLGYISLTADKNINLNADTSGGFIRLRARNGASSYRFCQSGNSTVEGFLNFQDLAVDRTYTFPDQDGTLALVGDATYVGDTPPTSPSVGDLWWNSSDASGRLFVYYTDSDSSQWVEASPQGDTLTETDANGLYLSKTNNDTAAGEITFEGVTTHEKGGTLLYAAANSQNVATFGSSTDQSVLAVGPFAQLNTTSSTVQNFQAIYKGTSHGNQTLTNIRSVFDADTNCTNALACYTAESAAQNSAKSVYGYYSNLSSATAPGGVAYTFYGIGDAPAFFKGSTYIGGNTGSTTFDLWKSTLTEEQLEQYEAGTYAVPANVSLPGDGSFARSWYYDQQDEETQALLDSGDLEYPAHLAAATFIDTFALGDNTAINLRNDGSSLFKGELRVSSTDSSDATASSIRVTTNRIFLNSDYDASIGTFRSTVNIGKSIPLEVTRRIAPTAPGSSSGQTYGMTNFLYLNQGGLNTNNASQRPAVYNGTLIFESDWVNTNLNNDLTHYAYLAKTSAAVDQTTANADQKVDACGFGAWTPASSATNFIGFEMINSGKNELDMVGFKSNLNVVTNGSNYNFCASGNAPNYFAGVVRTAKAEAPVGTGGDGNPQTNDDNRFWATASTDSNALRLGSGFQTSYYNSNAAGVNNYINRIGNAAGRLISFYNAGVYVDSIRFDGAGGITYGTSDYRTKENIVDLPSAVDQIKALRPVNFNFNWAPGKVRPGFIAHELAETLPVAVTGEKDETEAIGTLADYNGTVLKTSVTEPPAEELTYTEEVEVTPYVAAVPATYDEDGNEVTAEVPEVEPTYTTVPRTCTWTATGTQPVYQGVDQTKLIPLLTKALQEVLTKNEELEQRIAALEGA
jgi:hypothetical protein